MAKIVKLTPADTRIYRQNVSVLIDASGKRVRDITNTEEANLFDVRQKALRLGRPQVVELHDDKQNTVTKLEVKVDKLQSGAAVSESYVNGLRVIGGRDQFLKEIFEKHGECQVRSLHGHFLKSVRDPASKRPDIRMSSTISPRPENCQCRAWAGNVIGRHHRICHWNKYAPAEERALESGGDPDIRRVEVLPPAPAHNETPQFMNPVPVVHTPPNVLPLKEIRQEAVQEEPPQENAPEAKRERMVLVTLTERPKVVREATDDEILEAEEGFDERQMLAVTLGNEEYGVMRLSEVPAVFARPVLDKLDDMIAALNPAEREALQRRLAEQQA